MSKDIEKIASEVPSVMLEAAQHMRKLAEDNTELVQERNALQHELQATKLALRMEERGLEPNLTLAQKIAKLSVLPGTKLAATEQAVELAAGGFSLGHVENPNVDTKVASRGELYNAGQGEDELDNFVTSQRAFD